jgi:aminoglycoside phosphotransferase (APT) family kinase protein
MQSNTIDISLIEALVARVFPCTVPSHVERVEEGVSTYVYRIYRGNEIFYLRVLPEVNVSFAPEVYVHAMLRAKNVKVPGVVYFEHYNEAIQRSVMVTTAIKGKHIGRYPVNEVSKNTLVEAGRDLAIINSIPVRHFGWIRRDSCEVTSLEAEFPTYRTFIFEHLEEDLAFLGEHVLDIREVKAIWEIIDRFDAWLNIEQARLVHGDFDATHIYQEQGRYTGIIDFGEIRGEDPFYDLGHFQMHDGELLPAQMLPYLLAGYRDIVQLPPDYKQRIHFSSLLIALRALTRRMKKRIVDFHKHSGFASIKNDIEVLQHGSK